MNELEFQEEWLSAYLDDELTEEQRWVVEQRLATDPAAQATLEDLQRVRAMVSKLPNWSGPDLKFVMPSELPSGALASGELTDVETDTVENGQFDDFEANRSLSAIDQPQVAIASTYSNTNSRSIRSWLRWSAIAASVLIVASVGFLVWPPNRPSIAILDTKDSVESALPSSGTLGDMQSVNDDGTLREQLPTEELERVTTSDAPMGGMGRELAEYGESTRNLSISHPENFAFKAESTESPEGAKEKLELEMEELQDLEREPPAPAQALPGGGLGGAAMGLALGKQLSSDAPVAELPPPISNRVDIQNSNASLEDKSLVAASVHFARSQSWDNAEIRLNRFHSRAVVAENDVPQSGVNQQWAEELNDTVLMAAIKPEAANSPEFFQNMINSSQLITMEQHLALNLLSPKDGFDSDVKQEPDGTESLASSRGASETEQVRELPPVYSFQTAIPSVPTGNSFVLFVTRGEANRILNELQEKGQIVSQVWRVQKQTDSQTAARATVDKAANVPTPAKPQEQERVSGPALKKIGPESDTDKVILMLNGPPN